MWLQVNPADFLIDLISVHTGGPEAEQDRERIGRLAIDTQMPACLSRASPFVIRLADAMVGTEEVAVEGRCDFTVAALHSIATEEE